MSRLRVVLAAAVGLSLLLSGCAGSSNAGWDPGDRVKVVTSFYPLYFFADKIGGERVQVISLVASGVEPHDWEPKAGEIRLLNSAQVFIYNGAGFEPWVQKTLGSLQNRQLITVDSSAGVDLLHGDGDEQGDHGDHPGEAFDPHIWLDPVLNQHQVKLIAAALTKADPAGAATYAANAAALTAQLVELDQAYLQLSGCSRQEIVVSHDFFAYPAKRYGLEQLPIVAGVSPEAEPTPKQMAELVRLIRERNIRHIFFETLVSDKVARTIARETGVQTLVLNPIEGLTRQEEAQGKDFLALSRDNLAGLKVALGCSN